MYKSIILDDMIIDGQEIKSSSWSNEFVERLVQEAVVARLSKTQQQVYRAEAALERARAKHRDQWVYLNNGI
jgi:hypothetical protein